MAPLRKGGLEAPEGKGSIKGDWKMTCWMKEKDPKKRAELKKLHEQLGHSHDNEELEVMYA